MPLPKPPAKRAALLSTADFESQTTPRPGARPPKSRTAADPVAPAVLDLFDGTADAAAPVLAPSAALPKTGTVAKPAAPVSRRALVPETRARKPRGTGPATLFVLDTNVLMHDPMSLFRFEEHDKIGRAHV